MTESRQIALPAYLVSFALVVMPLADVMTTLYPWRAGDARWRFGAVGLISNAMILPLAGLLVAYVVATTLNHARFRRVLGVFGLLGALLGVVAIGMFALDSLQTRAAVRPEMRLSFTVASVAAALKTLVATATFAAVGIVALRSGRRSGGGIKERGVVPMISIDTAPASPVKSGPPPA